jgi:TetR/AcrR family transcriptional regulator, mexJK operon transcriptional repressor
MGMTKRTVYARYPTKAALFMAALQRSLERQAVSEATLQALDTGDFATTLAAVACLRVERFMTPAGLKLQRIIEAESYQFPEIIKMSYEQNSRPVIDFLARLIRRETAAGKLAVEDPERAAMVFLSMVVCGPLRLIASGNPPTAEDIEERLQFAIQLFMNGVRIRCEQR